MTTRPKPRRRGGRFWVAALPWSWMSAFVALPFALIVGVSLSTPELAVPPYVSAFVEDAGGWSFSPDWSSYARLGGELPGPGAESPPQRDLVRHGHDGARRRG